MPRPARVGRAAILRAALEVTDRDGVAALTMKKVAAQLGMSAMGLYRHVADKADLLDGLVELLLGEIEVGEIEIGPDVEPWEQRLRATGQSVRACARRHPAAFPLLLQRPAATPGARRVRDGVYAVLAAAGVPAGEVPRTERLVSTLVLGFCVSEVGGRFDLSPAALDEDFACLQDTVVDVLRRNGSYRES